MRRLGLAEWVAMAGPITSGRFVRYSDAPGPGQIDRFEAQLAETMGVRHTLTMTNGTAALVSILAAAGIGPGDEVIVPTFTWVATAIAPLAVGAVPVLADIDETMTLDATDLPRRLSPHTRADSD
jgi:dTDP-4-amino-4,6-dideoxygalactose transaminase